MKEKVLTYLYPLAFLLLLGGTLVLPPTSAAEFEVRVSYDPSKIDLAEPPPEYVNATLSIPRTYNASDVNGSTILMEGQLPQLFGYVIPKFNKYVSVFDGPSVVDIIWLKLAHMGVEIGARRPYRVPLRITGALYDGTTFEGTGYILVSTYGVESPPPPPPP